MWIISAILTRLISGFGVAIGSASNFRAASLADGIALVFWFGVLFIAVVLIIATLCTGQFAVAACTVAALIALLIWAGSGSDMTSKM